jgi:hypothetical protein
MWTSDPSRIEEEKLLVTPLNDGVVVAQRNIEKKASKVTLVGNICTIQ